MPPIDPEKIQLMRLMQEVEALQFGSFTLKSGRVSPYFFNSARFRTGAQLEKLGQHFARAIQRVAPQTHTIFGPAYKGVPLCITSAMALSHLSGRDIGYLFNRKEAKEHGDKGLFVGRQPEAGDSVVMVDDVITDGLTKHEAVALLRSAFNIKIEALVIVFNRMEGDSEGKDALLTFEEKTGIPVVSLLTVADVEAALAAEAGLSEMVDAPQGALEAIRTYRAQYGL